MGATSGTSPTPPYSVPPAAAAASIAQPPHAPNPSGGTDAGNTTAAARALFVPPCATVHTAAAATQLAVAQATGKARTPPRKPKALSSKCPYGAVGAASVAPPKKPKAPATSAASSTDEPEAAAPPSGDPSGTHTVYEEMTER
jgi:hypothetical protein